MEGMEKTMKYDGIIFDLDGDGEATSGDSNLINRSLISPSLRPYKAIEW